ncbi:Uncharacterized protein TCM_033180 [Theobroma cacao]|uniref:Uncharacterized protein n=1 Tax=Theobroma cacao TaxID=3641 RepID=A0A061FBC8_THECC|nr:Uncharacterized protein TCM_033180 [Theobroma cacao]
MGTQIVTGCETSLSHKSDQCSKFIPQTEYISINQAIMLVTFHMSTSSHIQIHRASVISKLGIILITYKSLRHYQRT